MATCRKLAIGALRLSGATNIAIGPRRNARDPARPLAMLGFMCEHSGVAVLGRGNTVKPLSSAGNLPQTAPSRKSASVRRVAVAGPRPEPRSRLLRSGRVHAQNRQRSRQTEDVWSRRGLRRANLLRRAAGARAARPAHLEL